uniref:Uncharacterized protein n=1 Tax=Octopus bimaculoides TaxID=37653 RepID=A0A0L8FUL2_OCTBM
MRKLRGGEGINGGRAKIKMGIGEMEVGENDVYGVEVGGGIEVRSCRGGFKVI